MVSIKDLQKSIAEEKRKVRKAGRIQAKEIKKSKLQKELVVLQRRSMIATKIATEGKGARLLRRAGKGIFEAGKRATPIIKKQARLIREQQLRDEAIERKLAKSRKPISKKKSKGFGVFGNLDF